ncbi:YegS/Rv2252/BmrU family lipid kinase [Flavobacterium selenitireducens]|uniref:YegS/Rv2252/BmrU family lipid kinase n=1 Tax=Flavobacterium selenitireducens TaxID=2722704 RepID=UPI00168AB6ED|nr:YegS/Rv2252/BmrU family lipid kinase [Flavobacterium selenitireducens]MBD3583334.1 YegS/Rv2252/BmrU family lipid kinase [Flavobacterium selenitireducens]
METTKTYLFVVNPISGDLDKAEILSQVETFAKSEGIAITTYETTGNEDEKAVLALYEQHKPDRILVAGGDGTIKMVAEAVEHQDVILGILPAGSANGLSVDLNFPTDIDEILNIAFHNEAMEIDMVCINGEKSLHLSDIGLNANLVKNYENSSVRGKIGYALQSIATLQEQDDPFSATIEVNGQTVETEARMIVFANSQKYGTGVTINPVGKMDDGKFEIVILKNLDLVLISKIVTGNMPLDTGEVEIFSTEKAKVTTSVPVHFQIDGEYFGEESNLEMSILPKQMKVAIPK